MEGGIDLISFWYFLKWNLSSFRRRNYPGSLVSTDICFDYLVKPVSFVGSAGVQQEALFSLKLALK